MLFVRKKEKRKNGNLTISVCNEAGGLFGAKVSGTLWVVGVQLCGIGKVVEKKKALKFEGVKEKAKGSDKHAATRGRKKKNHLSFLNCLMNLM